MAERVRNTSPIKINEFRIGSSTPTNGTNSFIELYNAGASPVDISGWTLTEHPTQQATFSTVKVPGGDDARRATGSGCSACPTPAWRRPRARVTPRSTSAARPA